MLNELSGLLVEAETGGISVLKANAELLDAVGAETRVERGFPVEIDSQCSTVHAIAELALERASKRKKVTP